MEAQYAPCIELTIISTTRLDKCQATGNTECPGQMSYKFKKNEFVVHVAWFCLLC
jgi:hypothetical protein